MAAPGFGEILTALKEAISIVLGIQEAQSAQATEAMQKSILTDVEIIKSLSTDPLYGFIELTARMSALSAQITALSTAIGGDFTTAIAATIAGVKAAPPPAWYTAPGAGLSADDVWSYVLGGTAYSTGNFLAEIGAIAYNTDRAAGLASQFAPWLRILSPVASAAVDAPNFGPRMRMTECLPTDTVLSWALREAPTFSWYQESQSHSVWGYYPSPHSSWYIMITLTDADVQAQGRANHPVATGLLPPIWPGLANVTLGTPVPLDLGVAIDEPMDGVLIQLASVPTKQGFFQFADIRSYRNVGGVAFVTDDGELEYPQNLGFTSAVYCPKTQSRAAGVRVRCAGGVTGTVTPWLIA